MTTINQRLFCRLDDLNAIKREEKRINILTNLGLLESDSIPVFDEATQTAARFLECPICILNLVIKDEIYIKAAVGLSRMGLMNQLATFRKINREESLCCYVIDSQQNLSIENALIDPFFFKNSLVVHYGIQAYLGTPLITSEGECIGTLAVLDLQPHQFTERDGEFLALTARWCLREYERDYLIKKQANFSNVQLAVNPPDATNLIKANLLEQLTQELRKPLTSVIGMASVLLRGVYGSLTDKQREYLDIIYNSGQTLSALVDEIINLGVFDEHSYEIHESAVNIEMLCQQVINNLQQIAKQRQQVIRLSVEPGHRIWLLDKEKVRQSLYYLIISVLESSEVGGEIRIHVSRKEDSLNIAVWLSHPYLGDPLSQMTENSPLIKPIIAVGLDKLPVVNNQESLDTSLGIYVITYEALKEASEMIKKIENDASVENFRELLGLVLSSYLVKIQGGQIVIQGSVESGYRYVLKLPKIPVEE